MNDAKYIGLDVHQATISVAVLDSAGQLAMEAILETKAETILQFIHGLRGSLHVTWEEGTCVAWLHDLLKPHVLQVVVSKARKHAVLVCAACSLALPIQNTKTSRDLALASGYSQSFFKSNSSIR